MLEATEVFLSLILSGHTFFHIVNVSTFRLYVGIILFAHNKDICWHSETDLQIINMASFMIWTSSYLGSLATCCLSIACASPSFCCTSIHNSCQTAARLLYCAITHSFETLAKLRSLSTHAVISNCTFVQSLRLYNAFVNSAVRGLQSVNSAEFGSNFPQASKIGGVSFHLFGSLTSTIKRWSFHV